MFLSSSFIKSWTCSERSSPVNTKPQRRPFIHSRVFDLDQNCLNSQDWTLVKRNNWFQRSSRSIEGFYTSASDSMRFTANSELLIHRETTQACLLTEFRSRLFWIHSLASSYSSIRPMMYSVSRESTIEAPLSPPANTTIHLYMFINIQQISTGSQCKIADLHRMFHQSTRVVYQSKVSLQLDHVLWNATC